MDMRSWPGGVLRSTQRQKRAGYGCAPPLFAEMSGCDEKRSALQLYLHCLKEVHEFLHGMDVILVRFVPVNMPLLYA
ncbi:hypothetical protein U9M48_017308 [Paspalum notatum var. saurae]|uniref:Uncharacterized protein n=1 Tax=Paspalum notatum var. saurae TaxID=547442 RepID=A0AAQ3T966_PASNO